MNFEQFTSTLIHEYKHVHPDFVQLALISLVIPVASAPWERGFSVQTSIKTKLRNRLNPERLNRMMMVRLVGPHFEDDDFLTAARAFNAMKSRQSEKFWSYWIVSWTLHPVLARDAAGKAKEATTPNFNLFLIT